MRLRTVITLLALMCATCAGASAQPAAQASAAPVIAPDGSLQYSFDSRTEPRLICRPLFICDIILQQGEVVLNVAIGDSLRWVIAAGQSGPSGSTPHVFVKPTEVGLTTNLVITTTKRTYYLRLESNSFTTAPRISFSYPADVAEAASKEAQSQKLEQNNDPELPVVPIDQLDYNYRIQGAPEITPSKVYNDGVHSYIEFTTLPVDLPIVLAIAPDGSDQIVNYRLKGSIFIVDGIQSGFDLVLNAGTGNHGKGERRVYIRHK